jgi:FkbM family methyltransferase
MNNLEQQLYQLRPALLAVWLKKLLGVRRRRAATKDGLQFMVDPVSHFGRSILDTSTYEPDMVDILRAILRPGDAYFDAGMNEGFFAVVASKIVGSQGRVLGAEPQGRLTGVIDKNFMLNDVRNAKVCEIALAAYPGTTVLYLTPDTNSGGSSFFRTTKLGIRPEAVRTLTLDALLEREGMKQIRFMKVDVEGAEEQILLGAEKTLADQCIDFLMVEFHPQITGQQVPKNIDKQLRAAGYMITQIANGGWIYHQPGKREQLVALGPLADVAPLLS